MTTIPGHVPSEYVHTLDRDILVRHIVGTGSNLFSQPGRLQQILILAMLEYAWSDVVHLFNFTDDKSDFNLSYEIQKNIFYTFIL